MAHTADPGTNEAHAKPASVAPPSIPHEETEAGAKPPQLTEAERN